MPKIRVLVVDDEPGMLEVCRDTLGQLPDLEVELEGESARAAERLAQESWDLLITDIRMPGLGGVELLELARQHDPQLAVLMLTAYPAIETAVASMKLGAADYITKPFLPEDLRTRVACLLESKRLRDENRLLRRHVERAYVFGDMIGRSPGMLAVFEAIERASASDVDVLILGETGTGKELVARCIHQRSRRSGNRFVPVDCGAIPEDLLESEFFGHERGAFTGAMSRSLGLVEFAARGTLFLDEVGNLPPRLQAKLLRALQERRIRRVGGTEEIEVDVRVVAASSLDLDEEVRQQRFRSDLYYRINVARIELPPLRERAGDIALLAAHLTSRYARELGLESIEIDPEALEVLCGYDWPGNVRELQNVIKRVLAMGPQDVIRVENLPDEVVARSANRPIGNGEGFFRLREHHMAAFERQYLSQLLRGHVGDVSSAAAEARLPRGTLYRLLKKYGFNPSDFREMGGARPSQP
ncbi:MAG: sigma-54-dependent Fis family transcriptional regulator [Gemmatimonadetes bacterium]|nr:sigma-54-dependent Fis family transcriptional regulator [Gemmatimonadota bacterium]